MNALKPSDQVWYIPGWLRSQEPIPEIMAVAQQTFPQASILFKSWDGENLIWPIVLANADKEAWRLAFDLAVMPEAQRSRLTLIGHSLGARMIIRILALLAKHQMTIQQAILLGAAIPADDPDLATIGQASRLPILAICNPKDVVLRYVYAVAGGEKDVAFGANGSLKPCHNLTEHILPATITQEVDISSTWAKVTLIKEVANHHELFYFNYLKRLFNEEPLLQEIVVPQGYPTLPQRVLAREIWWRVLLQDSGWKLEKHIITGHCRILNPNKVRTAWGRESRMRLAFAKVQRQIHSTPSVD